VCPYCRAPIEREDDPIRCEACATPHHADCYAENGGCTVFGCSKAPVDEPKISVTASEVNVPARPVAGASPRLPTPPPPLRPGSTSSVPPPPRPGDGSLVSLRSPGLELASRDDTTRFLTPPRNISFAGYNPPTEAATPVYIRRRSRLTYILLGVLLGAFGGHNFYAGYTKRGVIQLLLTVLSCFFGAIISWIWAIVEICIVTQDDDGVAFV
jgi:TM2 domain-containing membrane protein YozV